MGKISSRIIVLLIMVLIGSSLMIVVPTVYAGTLSCSVRRTSCRTGEVEIYEMKNTTNSTAAIPGSGYKNLVCCSISGGTLGNSCATGPTVLWLAGSTNALVSQTQTNPSYNNSVCLSAPAGGTASVGYASSCSPTYDTTLGSMSGTTGALVGSPNAYPINICASASAPPPGLPVSGVLTSSVFDSTAVGTPAGYNSIMWKGTQGTGALGTVRFQFAASNCSNGATNFPKCNQGSWSYYGGATCGASDWFDAPNPDTPIELKGTSCLPPWNNARYFRYKVMICSNDCVTSTGSTASPNVTSVVVNWAP